MESKESSASASPSLEDCLKLVRGERDEQRLAGLLLVTKFCNKDDSHALRQVYDAVSPQFLLRLLRTGMGKGGGGGENRDVYLQLSVSILAAFCRLPEIAASEDMVSKVPLIIEILSQDVLPSVIEGCYEIFILVSTSREDGVAVFHESGGFDALASSMCKLSDGSQVSELALKVVQLLMTKLPADKIYAEHSFQLSMMVVALAKLFAELHTALKFEALHLLYAILSSKYASPVHSALSSKTDDAWTINMRVGIVAILQNRVAPDDKLKALVLAECVSTIVGEGWLTGVTNLPDDAIPADRCMLVVLESSRVEMAILLNELAHLRDESSKGSSSSTDIILQKQRNVGITFSLVEKIIKILSELSEDEDSNAIISETMFMKIMKQLNETINVVLEYIEDAKEHGARKGDDLLASVRLVGSYLAQTPQACEEKVRELLSYMLSVEGMDEQRPFYSVCFLLPMLCQITMRTDGCRALTSTGALDAVVNCLISMITDSNCKADESTTIFLACDTILNLLTKRGQLQISLDTAALIKLLRVLTHWTEVVDDPSVLMMASSICSLVLDSTSEEALLHHPNFDNRDLISMALLIQKSLSLCGQDAMCEDAKQQADLHDIVVSAYSRWADRFPHLRAVVEK